MEFMEVVAIALALLAVISGVWGISERVARKVEKKSSQDHEPIYNKIGALETQISNLALYIKEYNSNRDKTEESQTALHLEQTKRFVRDAHMVMHDTGEVQHEVMAYMDKIVPHYFELGGNSDIRAKYEEMRRTYERRMTEKLDDKHNCNRGKKSKEVESEQEVE